MEKTIITRVEIERFAAAMIQTEKSIATREKYMRDVRAFASFCGERPVTKELVIAYKEDCRKREYAVRSINSMLASINSFLDCMGWHNCRVKSIRMQKQTYCPADKELTKGEYIRLLKAAEGNKQLQLVLETICGTGIRVSELQYFTVEGVQRGEITVNCKGKTRVILIPGKLQRLLLRFARKRRIKDGPVFIGKNGKALDRSMIWRQMKHLCAEAGVQASKVFPHNLRKLFARTFYNIEKDIAKLADILGHGSINTTRIYLLSTGTEHRRKIERLGLVI